MVNDQNAQITLINLSKKNVHFGSKYIRVYNYLMYKIKSIKATNTTNNAAIR